MLSFNLHYDKTWLPVVLTLMLYFLILNIPNFYNIVTDFVTKSDTLVSLIQKILMFANIDW